MQKFISSCLFIWDNQTTVDKRQAQEPSIYFLKKKLKQITMKKRKQMEHKNFDHFTQN